MWFLWLLACSSAEVSDSNAVPPIVRHQPEMHLERHEAVIGHSLPSSHSRELPDNPIVVHWTIDTLSLAVAEEVGICEDLKDLFRDYGRDIDCRMGGISPSSWTIESTLRMIWPEHTAGIDARRLIPSCDSIPAPTVLADALGAKTTLGFDNAMLHRVMTERSVLCDGRSSWLMGFDTSHVNSSTLSLAELIDLGEAERSLNRSMSDLLAWAEKGESVVAVFNDFEAGGHTPRCPGPPTPNCLRLFNLAKSNGIIEADAVYGRMMKDVIYWGSVHAMLVGADDMKDHEVRELVMDTIVESARYYWQHRALPRFTRLASELDAMDRLQDLILVVPGDHGERPCHRSVESGRRSCGHGGNPDPWTVSVPVYIMPAYLGRKWATMNLVGDADTPWSTANLFPALYQEIVGHTPPAWPAPVPAGTAASWSCWGTDTTVRQPLGLYVSGDEAVQCNNTCIGLNWAFPTDRSFMEDRRDLSTLSDETLDWVLPLGKESSHRFNTRCGWSTTD